MCMVITNSIAFKGVRVNSGRGSGEASVSWSDICPKRSTQELALNVRESNNVEYIVSCNDRRYHFLAWHV